jgi:hypothetical protein
VFGDTIDYAAVCIHRRTWWPLQPRHVAMAPTGHIHFHPHGDLWCQDFSKASLSRQGFFIHEMTHVWQTQQRGRWYLVLMRHPFCRYRYTLRPGSVLEDYGLEQQAEIIRHVFLHRQGYALPGKPPLSALEPLLPPDFP